MRIAMLILYFPLLSNELSFSTYEMVDITLSIMGVVLLVVCVGFSIGKISHRIIYGKKPIIPDANTPITDITDTNLRRFHNTSMTL